MENSARRSNYRLTEAEKADARIALRILKGTNAQLADAARYFVMCRPSITHEDIPLSLAIDRFMSAKRGDGLRPATIRYYGEELTRFMNDFKPETSLHHVTRKKLNTYLERMDISAASVSCRFRAIRALYRWATTSEPSLIPREADPTKDLSYRPRFPRKGKNKPSFHDDAAVQLIIQHSDEKFRPALALMYFAGIRPQEVKGVDKPPLCWEHMDPERKEIIIPAEIAKTGFARLLDCLPDNLWKIVDRLYDRGPICPTSMRHCINHARAILKAHTGKEEGQEPVEWSQDVARHTFATFHVFKYRDPGLTSTILGHQGDQGLLFKHYRGQPIRGASEMAERYFNIT